MLVLVYWPNHFTPHSWSSGYNEAFPAVTAIRLLYLPCVFVCNGFVLWCGSCKCRQVLGYSSSSQISGTCDSQACCCCGDLNMGVKCISFCNAVVGSARYSHLISMHSCWSPSYNTGFHQDLFSRSTPQESNVGPASATNSTDWRNCEFC